MYPDAAFPGVIHRSLERLVVRHRGAVDVDRNVDVAHPETSDGLGLSGLGVLAVVRKQIDHAAVARGSDHGELLQRNDSTGRNRLCRLDEVVRAKSPIHSTSTPPGPPGVQARDSLSHPAENLGLDPTTKLHRSEMASMDAPESSAARRLE